MFISSFERKDGTFKKTTDQMHLIFLYSDAILHVI